MTMKMIFILMLTLQIMIFKVADTTKTIANQYGVLIEEAGIALRGLFLINPEGELEQITVNNLPVGKF